MNYFKISMLSSLSLLALAARAGTVAVEPYSADLDSVAHGVWGVNYDSNVLSKTDFEASIRTDSKHRSIAGAPTVSYKVVWSPRRPGETPPRTVSLSFRIYGSVHGPRSSSGSIKTASGAVLLTGLSASKGNRLLYTTTVTARMIVDHAHSMVIGFCVIPLDVLTSAGGATVAEKATYVPPPGILFASLARRKAVRVYTFRKETVSIYSTAKRTRRGGVSKSG